MATFRIDASLIQDRRLWIPVLFNEINAVILVTIHKRSPCGQEPQGPRLKNAGEKWRSE